MFADEFGIDPDARALLEEFMVGCKAPCSLWFFLQSIISQNLLTK
jgi:hypothetical protein